MARRSDAGPEVLHYLAVNGAPATRAAVAANLGASAATNRLLADDGEAEVRSELAVKIARLLPGLSGPESAHIFALTIETLEALARDAAVTVRALLAEEIKSLNCVPPAIVKQLAQDAESSRGGADPGIFAAALRRRPDGNRWPAPRPMKC